ncbi:MAG: biotin--[acetyl-CoA-carboxylase] ligase [Thermoanaerobacteraceae bacterium]
MLKSEILQILKDNTEKYTSGQYLCSKFNVSRTAVWKCINQLKKEGYNIKSHHKLGYRLLKSSEFLYYEEISPFLNTKFIGRNFIHYDIINSTNTFAKEIASKSPDGTLVIAEEQTSGRGRLGRSWVSPKGCGIWMSIILKPHLNPQNALQITQVAALAIQKAIVNITNLNAKIKWPNDIIINNKKVCGILTEMNSEIDKINYIIAGIGINVNCTNFPEEIKNIATSLSLEKKHNIDRKKILIEILNLFENYYMAFLDKGFTSIKNLIVDNSLTIGKDVKIIYNNKELKGKAIGIDDNGYLIIKTASEEIIPVISSEVSVRSLSDYI